MKRQQLRQDDPYNKEMRRHCTSSNPDAMAASAAIAHRRSRDFSLAFFLSFFHSLSSSRSSSVYLAQFVIRFVQLNQIHLWRPGNHAVSHFELNYDDECDFMDFAERKKKTPSLNVILCNFFF